jgi:hypothetical protein
MKWITNFDSLSDDELKKIAEDMQLIVFLPDEFIKTDGTPDEDKIQSKRELFKEYLISYLFSAEGYGQVGFQLGVQLAPIHAIAQGMYSICDISEPDRYECWNTSNYKNFDTKVQGSLDRNVISQKIVNKVSRYQPYYAEVNKKIGWLKRWIVNEATDEELRNFLKFATGSSSLPTGPRIKIREQLFSYLPCPRAHTCFHQIDISPEPCSYANAFNDHNYENFIDCLKKLALVNPGDYQMS